VAFALELHTVCRENREAKMKTTMTMVNGGFGEVGRASWKKGFLREG
jgi:hypothetical protein